MMLEGTTTYLEILPHLLLLLLLTCKPLAAPRVPARAPLAAADGLHE
jgi:hypothetical protein